MSGLPVAIIGGGPIGLAALAHLLERGERAVLFEAGETVGASIRGWGHARMFSPWEFNVDSASVRLLKQHGWAMPPEHELPTGEDLYERYLRPLAELPSMRGCIRTGVKVIAVSRRHIDKMKDGGRGEAPFQLHIARRGNEAVVEARAVIDASGTWHKPNPMGANGLPAIGERSLKGRIFYGIPDINNGAKARYAGKRVIVIGSGHSAINALLDLIHLKESDAAAQIVWAMRGGNLQKVYGGGENDALPARGQLGRRIQAAVAAGLVEVAAPFRIAKLEAAAGTLRVHGEMNGAAHSIPVDEIIVCAGARPALDMLGELRLDLDPAVESSRALAPLIDPNIHSCGTVRPHGEAELRQPEKDFYILGMKSYGRAPTFLLATGYEQARSVTAALAGDWEAARDVRLNLPATGVCVTDFAAPSCCAPAPGFLSIDEIPAAQMASATNAADVCC